MGWPPLPLIVKLGKSMQHSASIHPLRWFSIILRINARYYFCDPKRYMAKINWAKVVNYRAREIQIRMPQCPTHYTNMRRAMDILKNPVFWMFVAAVVLINTFISPRILDNMGGFFVSQVSSALLRFFIRHVLWGYCTCMPAFFRKNALSFIIRYSRYF